MLIRMCFAIFFTTLLVGCDKFMQPSEGPSTPKASSGWSIVSRSEADGNHRYQLHAASDGKMYRLDTRTGQTSLVTDKGLKSLADDRSIELRVGQIYKLENGKSALYEGNEKLNSDTRRIADALVEKYSDKSIAGESRKPQLSLTNAKGWKLMIDANGNKAYVGPNNEIEEVK